MGRWRASAGLLPGQPRRGWTKRRPRPRPRGFPADRHDLVRECQHRHSVRHGIFSRARRRRDLADIKALGRQYRKLRRGRRTHRWHL